MVDFINSLEPKDWVTLSGIVLTFLIGILNLFNGIRLNKRTLFVNAVTSERVKWMGTLKELLSEYLSLTSYYDSKPFLEGENQSKYFERLIYLQTRIKLHLNYIDHKDQEINDLIEKINNKIFGLYEARNILLTDEAERIRLLSDEKMQKYINKVLTEKEINKELIRKVIEHRDQKAFFEIFNLVIAEINKDFREKYGEKGKHELIHYTNELVDKARIYLKDEWEKVKREAQKGNLKKENLFKKIIKLVIIL